jgi:hypothetical protein
MRYSNALIFLLLLLLLSVGACRKKPAQTPASNHEAPETTTDAVTAAPDSWDQTAPNIEMVLDLWKQGQKDESTKAFLSIQWDQPLNFSPHSVFALSENQFIAMPQAQRTQVQQQAMDVSEAVRVLARHMIILGQAHLAKKEYDAAQKCFTAVSDFGKAVSDLDTLLLLKRTGSIIQIHAAKGLAALHDNTEAK